MAYCRECGASIDEAVKFCPECGTPAGVETAAPPVEEEPPPKSWFAAHNFKRGVGIALVAIAAITILGAIFGTDNKKPAPKTNVANVAPGTTPSPTPKPPGTGDTIRIGSGEQQIDVKVLQAVKVRWVPFLGSPGATEPGVKLSGGWRIFVVLLRFKNTGSSFYHSRVANWSWLDVKQNPASHIEAMGTEYDFDYQDLQSDGDTLEDIGLMQLDPGHAEKWFVAFKIRAVAKPVSFTYQGPGDQKATWVF